jgi:hypothetical protein
MNLDKFRLEMAAYRQSVDEEAKSLKDSYGALERLCALYRKFDDAERLMADEVLGEWVLSDDEGIRFDAIALIDKLEIRTAIPMLHKLAVRLASGAASAVPSAPYELKKVHRVIARLDALGEYQAGS